AGAEINGQTTAQMLGLGRMVSVKKDSIGAIMSRREGLAADKRRLVGLRPLEPQQQPAAGSHLFTEGVAQSMATDQGWVTSSCYSPHLKSYIALGFLENGDSRLGEIVTAANPLEGAEVRAEIVSTYFVDPE